jgi:hypothetical protein
VTIPTAIFNNRFDQLADQITDTSTRDLLTQGLAYDHASQQSINSLSGQVRDQVIGVYSDSLRRAWQISIVFAGVAFLAVFLEKKSQ